mmetsp:Transcript_21532/g.54512  ORF Transcript_21532/g.54512 Transcript_21532/m.54512 type:complete len:95 (-) Transcript_21532:555-839(-)
MEPMAAASDQRGLLIVGIHWGPNWAYRNGDEQEYRRQLAHRLVDRLGGDLICGHSSHHMHGLEVHKGKLIIYGAGDLINDYESIAHPGDRRTAV